VKKGAIFAIAALFATMAAPASAAKMGRVTLTGEIIDSWCYLTQIMYGEGTAHHQCALWCAAGGIPVGLLADDGKVYVILKLGADTTSVANPAVMRIQTQRITVNGDVYTRAGINYLVIDKVVNDAGIVKLTHDEYGIQPFGK
jgi:type 1 fimbria pilin